MGLENDAILSYLEDNARFADLFNRFYFRGKEIVQPHKLKEASEVYTAQTGEKNGQRIRDIKKRLETGVYLKILAVEAQNEINYIMPWRVMEYDCKEYGKQIRKIQRENQEAEDYGNAGERLSKFRRTDRLAPVYTLCLYHGAEKWDGPRCLKDMVDFGSEEAEWEQCFADYPMHLICANEPVDCADFRTSLGALFALLPLRKDKARLKKLVEENPVYQRLDEDTARTASILMGVKIFMEHKEKYKNEEGYNVCQAIREMMEDSRAEGWASGEKAGWTQGEKAGWTQGEKAGWTQGEKAGLETGIRIFIQSNRDDGAEDTVISDKLQKYYGLSQKEALKFLDDPQVQ